MVNFKKVLGLAAPALVFAGMAFGQTPIACTLAAPGAPFLRAEGTTELLPQVTVNGASNPCVFTGTPGPYTATVFVTPVVGITSKVLNSSGFTEATASLGGGTAVQGTVSGNAITFTGLTGTGALVISNIRINASQIPVASGIPNAASVSVFISSGTQVVATVASAPVGYVVNGLATSKISGAGAIPVCNGSSSSSAAFTVTLGDAFIGAFKTMAGEASTVPTTPSNAVNSATRVKLVFSNVPTGATIYVPTSVTNSNASAINLTASETGAFSQVAAATGSGVPANTAAVTVSGGTGQAVYDVGAASTTALDSFIVPVYVVSSSNGVTPSSTPISVMVSFAPIGSTNIPNFVVGSSTTPLSGSNFTVCATNLLFSYLVNQAGYDTGLAIANTSTDPFGKNGATPQAGNCTLNFYGAGAPAAVTSPMVPSGTVWTQILSSIAPGFQGYMIAQCNFLYGHGYAFISSGLGMNSGVAEGYLAGVIPDVNLKSRGSVGSGESLGN